MKLKLTKMQGCGNDFLFLDELESEPTQFSKREVMQLCDRHYGVGADGLVVLHASRGKADAAWTFYNCDGSQAEMCGNAARCAMRYLSEKHFPGERTLSLETKAGVIRGRYLENGLAEVALFAVPELKFEYTERVVSTEKNVFNVLCVNTGVPHAVIEVKDILTYPIQQVGRLLVNHPAFAPHGSNITFYQRVVSNRILSTTFERGVEAETFACGTGAAAAAIIFTEQYLQGFPVEVAVPGGDLIIDISPVSKMLLLRGPAHTVYEIEVDAPNGQFEPPTLYSERKRHTS